MWRVDDPWLFFASLAAIGLVLLTAYRIAVYRAHRRLHGRSTRDRERNLPAILRFERWLKRTRRRVAARGRPRAMASGRIRRRSR